MAKKTADKEVAVKPAAKKTPEKAIDTQPAKKNPAKKKKALENKLANELSKEERIRLAAYFRWQEKGCQHGADLQDWLEAEKSVTD